jgi:diaminopropionate ammonia-lyase
VSPARAPAARDLGWYANPAARVWRCAGPPDDALAFHARLPGYARTPLVELPTLAEEVGAGRVFVKDESRRFGLPAFKALGASWAIASVIADRRGLAGPLDLPALRAAARDDPVTLVTATDGNHGRAVAWMAALLGLSAHVFVPQTISPGATAAIEAEGATVTQVGDCYDVTVERAAAAAAADPSGVLVQDTAWAGYELTPGRIVEGYDTMLAEIDTQLAAVGIDRLDLVAVPVGVGSLAQAVVRHYRSRSGGSAPVVLGVEPDTAACVLTSLLAGGVTSVRTAATVMAGLNTGTPSALAWPVLEGGLDAAIAVTDAAAGRAVDDLATLGVSAGPSGAAALAGARAALTGPAAGQRRAGLGLSATSTVVLLSTEGRGDPGPAAWGLSLTDGSRAEPPRSR